MEETLRTLQLLFPHRDKDIEKWLKKKAKALEDKAQLDLGLLDLDRLLPQHRRIENFKFWRDQLIELKERFDQPGLTSLSQLWYDRRNRGQWITFWFGLVIAIATLLGLVLGMFQTALGAVQVYKAYHPAPG